MGPFNCSSMSWRPSRRVVDLTLGWLSVLWVMALGGVPSDLRADELRDPFVFGPRQEVSASAQPVLEGILWDATSPLAIMQGNPVSVGDAVSGWRIVEIHPDHVVLERNAQRKTLMPGSPVPSVPSPDASPAAQEGSDSPGTEPLSH